MVSLQDNLLRQLAAISRSSIRALNEFVQHLRDFNLAEGMPRMYDNLVVLLSQIIECFERLDPHNMCPMDSVSARCQCLFLNLTPLLSSPFIPCGAGSTSLSLLCCLDESSQSIAIFCHSLPLLAVHLCPFEISLNTLHLNLGLPLLLLTPISVSHALFVNLSSLILPIAVYS